LHNIIIVTGTPGVGKTVLSRQLSTKTNSRHLNLGEFVKKEKLYSGYDRSTKSYIIDEKRTRRSLSGLFRSSSTKRMVIETHWLGGFMPKGTGMMSIVLRLDPLVLAKRLKARKWPRRKVWENVEAELIDLSLYEALKFLGQKRVYQIDATRKRHPKILNEALRLLSEGKGWDGSTPNWLARYDPIELSRKLN
jgi:adenylate kinase